MKIKALYQWFIFGSLFLLGLSSCSSSKAVSGRYAALEYDAVTITESKADAAPAAPTQERILLYQAYLSLSVDSIKKAQKMALTIIKPYNGYMVSTSNNQLSVRVPATDLNAILIAFKKLGEVDAESINGRDVTDEYYDIKIRLENAVKTRERYLELLNDANNVTEVLQIEKELERLNATIDSYKGLIKRYDQEKDYSLINVYFYEKRSKPRPGPLGYIFVGLYRGIKWLFVWD